MRIQKKVQWVQVITLEFQLIVCIVVYMMTDKVDFNSVGVASMIFALLIAAVTRDGVLYMVAISSGVFVPGAISIADLSTNAAYLAVAVMMLMSYDIACGIMMRINGRDTFRPRYFFQALPIIGLAQYSRR